MPYISKKDRKKIAPQLLALVKSELFYDVNKDNHPAVLNYVICKTVDYLLGDSFRYKDINALRGAIIEAWAEIGRRIVVPYENSKIKENGDVFRKRKYK